MPLMLACLACAFSDSSNSLKHTILPLKQYLLLPGPLNAAHVEVKSMRRGLAPKKDGFSIAVDHADIKHNVVTLQPRD